MNDEILEVLSRKTLMLTESDKINFRIPKGLFIEMKKSKEEYPFIFWRMKVFSGNDHDDYILIFNSVKNNFLFDKANSEDFKF